MEIERKFLVTSLPDGYERLPALVIKQGYLLPATRQGIEFRVRQKADLHFLTIKHGEGLCRTEIELPLSPADFETLWPMTAGRRLCKTRYLLPWGEWLVELDVFDEDLCGLCLAEVEFTSVEASRRFQVPPFFGREITDDPAYRNANLARRQPPRPTGGLPDLP